MHVPTVWKVILPDELVAPSFDRPVCRPRGDSSVTTNIRDRTYVQGRAPFTGQARPCEKGVNCGSSPVTTAAPLKGSPAPSPSPNRHRARHRPNKPSQYIEAMREVVQKTTTSQTEPAQPSTFSLDPDLEARFAEQDRQHTTNTKHILHLPRPKPTDGCPQCGHDRLMGGSCDQCGYDDGTGFQVSADYNNGH